MCWQFDPVLKTCSCHSNLFLSSRFVPDFSTVADCCWLFLIFPVLCFNDFQFNLKSTWSNFLILVDRVANWGKLRKAIFLILCSSRDSHAERLQPIIGGFNGFCCNISKDYLQRLSPRIIFEETLQVCVKCGSEPLIKGKRSLFSRIIVLCQRIWIISAYQ